MSKLQEYLNSDPIGLDAALKCIETVKNMAQAKSEILPPESDEMTDDELQQLNHEKALVRFFDEMTIAAGNWIVGVLDIGYQQEEKSKIIMPSGGGRYSKKPRRVK